MSKRAKIVYSIFCVLIVCAFFLRVPAYAADATTLEQFNLPNFPTLPTDANNVTTQDLPTSATLDALNNGMNLFDTPQNTQRSLQIILILTILALAPSILIMMTCFTRIIICLSFIRNAMGTQQMPSNQVLIGLALFLTYFIMAPTIDNINVNAYQPYMAEEISDTEALDVGLSYLRDFMVKHTKEADVIMFASLSERQTGVTYGSLDEVGLTVIIPAFITSEIKQAFIFGFVIYIPFIVIDMVVASVLMSMGMMMLPPVMISLPFKIMLFVLVDGWGMMIGMLVKSYLDAP